ncbi:MAG: class D beta-lactamase [Gammaproteobacteria bacterium]|nr:class D beta-lactamase [Gammaproteobacteria bacterium]
MRFVFTASLWLLCSLNAQALEMELEPADRWQERADIGQLFAQAGLQGTLVVLDVQQQRYSGYNRERAEQRLSPASTFKIANSLIGLDAGAVGSVDEPLPYEGPAQPFIAAWAVDMGLRQAMPMSNVPIYQTLARRIGLARMQAGVDRLAYGNRQLGEKGDRFWLDGPLAISAREQADFLALLAQGKLDFAPQVQQQVAEILLQDQDKGWQLHAKTGWQNAPNAGVGWWVGWVRRGAAIHSFALNLDLSGAADAPKREELGRASLRMLGLLD